MAARQGASPAVQGAESDAMEADVYVNVIDAVDPSSSSAGATVELVTELGTVVRRGVVGEEAAAFGDTATEWGVIFGRFNFGRYLLRVTRDDSYGAPVWLELDRPVIWANFELHPRLPEEFRSVSGRAVYDERWLETIDGTVVGLRSNNERPMWAKLISLYSERVEHSRIDEEGRFRFRVDPGSYMLIIFRGNTPCDDVLVLSPSNLEIDLAGKACE